MDYQELRDQVFADKDREAAKALVLEALRRGDAEAYVFARLAEVGPLAFREIEDDEEIMAATEFFEEMTTLLELDPSEAMAAYLELAEAGLILIDPPDKHQMGYVDIRLRPCPALPQEDLREFVRAFLAGEIFTSAQIAPRSVQLGMVFMPVLFGALGNTDIRTVGVLWEYLSKAGPRSINGYPGFFSFRIMNTGDWDRVLKVIIREQERLENLEI
jgi:hypothetical protein